MMKSIIKRDSGVPGPTLAIFCGVHGNELAGILAVKKALEELVITRGVVYFAFANPLAIEHDVRSIDDNLNRCFLPGQNGDSYEERRAAELLPILDEVDAVLDLHSSNNPNTTPFAICEQPSFGIVSRFPIDIIATGFDKLEPGATDGYMQNQGKIGICVECGYNRDGEKNLELAYTCLLTFLDYYSVTASPTIPLTATNSPRVLHVDTVQFVTDDSFDLIRSFRDFETVPPFTLLAKSNEQEFTTDSSERAILFATPGRAVGTEAYILGIWQ